MVIIKMFCNICVGDMGKFISKSDTQTFTHQDSDQSIPLCLVLCIIEIILPTLHLISISIDNTKIVNKTVFGYL